MTRHPEARARRRSSRTRWLRARRSCAWPGRSRARFAASAPISATRSTRCRSARRCPCVVTVHDVSFEREPDLMGRKDRLVFRLVVPRAVREPQRVLTVSERTKARSRRALRRPARARSSSRRTASTLPSRQARALTTTSSRSGRSRRGRTSSPRSRRPSAVGLPLVVAGPEKDAALAAELRGSAARGSRATSTSRGSRSSTAAPRASCSRAGTRASACRSSRRWRPGRRSSPSPIPRS